MGKNIVNRKDLKDHKENERGLGLDLIHEHRDMPAGFSGRVKPTKSRRTAIGASIVATRLLGLGANRDRV
jgi:hypothetical protein